MELKIKFYGGKQMEIRDITTHSQRDKDKTPRIYEISVKGIRYTVHRHIYYPGTWLLTCRDIGIEMEDLKTDDAQQALHNAMVFILGALDGLIAKYTIIRNELSQAID